MTSIPFTALTSKGEKVQLVAEGHLAVGANRFNVADTHGRVTAVLLRRFWSPRRRHGGDRPGVYVARPCQCISTRQPSDYVNTSGGGGSGVECSGNQCPKVNNAARYSSIDSACRCRNAIRHNHSARRKLGTRNQHPPRHLVDTRL